MTRQLSRPAAIVNVMARRADPARIETARRAATVARLVSDGELPDRATTLVSRWETTVAGSAGRSDWEAFDGWLERARAADRAGSSALPDPLPRQPGRQAE